jgi:hypothetical protein
VADDLLQLWRSCKRCKAVLSCSQPGSLTQLQQQQQCKEGLK